jgi:hypothetical protein
LDEGQSLVGQGRPELSRLRTDHDPFPHRLAFGRVERFAAIVGDQLVNSICREFHYEASTSGHGEDASVDLKGVRAEAPPT